MRKFKIKVNDKSYEVEVEEIGGTSAPVMTSAPVASAAPAPAATASAPAGSTEVAAPMPGSIIDVKVKNGDKVSEGDVLLILEAMKMENEIRYRNGGIVKAVHVSAGQAIEGDVVLVEIEPEQ